MVACVFRGLGLSALAFAFVVGLPARAQELTISVWGGGYGETWKKVAVDPFVAQTGIKVTVDMGPANQRLSKLLAARGGVDLMFITDHQMAVAKSRGLLEAFDPVQVPNAANLIDFARDPLGDKLCPAITVLGIGMAYNKDHFPTPPKAWGDLLRNDLKAPQAFMDIAFSVAPSMLVQLAELNGGSIDNVDPGIKAMADRYVILSAEHRVVRPSSSSSRCSTGSTAAKYRWRQCSTRSSNAIPMCLCDSPFLKKTRSGLSIWRASSKAPRTRLQPSAS